ncbi:ribonuclease III [Prevotella pectinovora]|uniref:ribonuclease III n=1 Tax=Prevotella pectinovora TaxID=1602169 RepID=UPI0025908341|nr:ribonuclease III [Prevotella pectinovora]MEE1546554.1 ribonuclease III [Prevotella pectinovora]
MINNFIDRMRLPFSKDKELRAALYEIFGFYPHRIQFYKLALMHKSVTRRNEKGKPLNNERLEFLGDAILDAIVGDIVYRHFEGKREGFLTSTRSKIVQRDTLNRLATEMGITQLIKFGKHTPSHNSYMGGNAFEALVGAMYLDRGYEACMRFMEKRILSQLINIDKVAYKEINFKSKLIEWCQKNKVKLDFKLLEQSREGKNSPIFKYQVLIEGLEGGVGEGYSKKESQQLASKITLQQLKRKPQFIDAVFTAKGNRTKMEEEPVLTVPDTEQKTDFIIPQAKDEGTAPVYSDKVEEKKVVVKEKKEADEFDFSDIQATPKEVTSEDIIAASMAEAYKE